MDSLIRHRDTPTRDYLFIELRIIAGVVDFRHATTNTYHLSFPPAIGWCQYFYLCTLLAEIFNLIWGWATKRRGA